MSREFRLSGGRLASSAGDIDIASLGNAIDCQEAKIVRRELVLDAGIAQTDNQLHSYFLPSAFLPPSALLPSVLPPSAAPSSVSCLPFLMTSGSAGAAAATSAPASAGAASTTSFTDVIWATG